jgi:hypothetical protein
MFNSMTANPLITLPQPVLSFICSAAAVAALEVALQRIVKQYRHDSLTRFYYRHKEKLPLNILAHRIIRLISLLA